MSVFLGHKFAYRLHGNILMESKRFLLIIYYDFRNLRKRSLNICQRTQQIMIVYCNFHKRCTITMYRCESGFIQVFNWFRWTYLLKNNVFFYILIIKNLRNLKIYYKPLKIFLFTFQLQILSIFWQADSQKCKLLHVYYMCIYCYLFRPVTITSF